MCSVVSEGRHGNAYPSRCQTRVGILQLEGSHYLLIPLGKTSTLVVDFRHIITAILIKKCMILKPVYTPMAQLSGRKCEAWLYQLHF